MQVLYFFLDKICKLMTYHTPFTTIANSEKIRTYSSSRSSKVINLGANRKRICNFLLVINSKYGRLSYRFRDIEA